MSNHMQDNLSKKQLKNVNNWDKAVSAAEALIEALVDKAKLLRKSVQGLNTMRDSGKPFPDGFESTLGLLGQDGHLGQSPAFQRFSVSACSSAAALL